MTGPTWHRELPYRELLRGWRWVRRTLFRAPRPEGRYLYVPPRETGSDPAAVLRRTFGLRGYGPGYRFSYDKGADCNLRFVFLDAERAPSITWWQTHLRVWVSGGGGAWLCAHVEPTPEDHPKAHLDGVGLDRADGLREVATTLDAAGVSYQRREWRRAE